MVNWICGVFETVIESFAVFGLFIGLCGREKVRGTAAKMIAGILMLRYFRDAVIVNVFSLQSTSVIMIDLMPLAIIISGILVAGEFFRAVSWGVFAYGTILAIRLPVVMVSSAVYCLDYLESNESSPQWTKLVILAVYLLLFLVCFLKRVKIIQFMRSMLYQRSILMAIGVAEYAIVLYIVNVGWDTGYDIHSLILMSALLLLLFTMIISLVVLMEYHVTVKKNCMLLANESKMRKNYELLSSEIASNHKNIHDKRHEFAYIHSCLEHQEYEKALVYTEEKLCMQQKLQKHHTWTGYGTIDYLLNRISGRCEEMNIMFQSDLAFLMLPTAEYDFFVMLANLLDNALEAASICTEGERYIILKMHSSDNHFRLYLANSYAVEPKKEHRRLVSNKGEDGSHGWGVENVKDLVAKYDGIIDITYGGGKFEVDIILTG